MRLPRAGDGGRERQRVIKGGRSALVTRTAADTAHGVCYTFQSSGRWGPAAAPTASDAARGHAHGTTRFRHGAVGGGALPPPQHAHNLLLNFKYPIETPIELCRRCAATTPTRTPSQRRWPNSCWSARTAAWPSCTARQSPGSSWWWCGRPSSRRRRTRKNATRADPTSRGSTASWRLPRAGTTAMKKSRIVTEGISGGGSLTGAVTRRLPISLDTMVPRTGNYTYDVGFWDLSIVQGPFSVAPCRTLALRFATLLHRCRYLHALHCERELRLNVVPVDDVARAVVACAFQVRGGYIG